MQKMNTEQIELIEELSDRKFERFIAENAVAKWFCGFGLLKKTPDFTIFDTPIIEICK